MQTLNRPVFKRRFFATMIFSIFFGVSSSSGSTADFKFIDGYLADWDRFALGTKELAARLKTDASRFQKELSEVLNQGDKRAPSRLVFYAVVQVGGFIRYDSDLGRALEKFARGEVPIFTSEKGERSYFAGDPYFWWERHRKEFASFPLFDEWRQRDFAKTTVIPMYKAATTKR
jgi:hypothetical protein